MTRAKFNFSKNERTESVDFFVDAHKYEEIARKKLESTSTDRPLWLHKLESKIYTGRPISRIGFRKLQKYYEGFGVSFRMRKATTRDEDISAQLLKALQDPGTQVLIGVPAISMRTKKAIVLPNKEKTSKTKASPFDPSKIRGPKIKRTSHRYDVLAKKKHKKKLGGHA